MQPGNPLEVVEYVVAPGEYLEEWFALPGDMAVYVVSGELEVEVEGADRVVWGRGTSPPTPPRPGTAGGCTGTPRSTSCWPSPTPPTAPPSAHPAPEGATRGSPERDSQEPKGRLPGGPRATPGRPESASRGARAPPAG